MRKETLKLRKVMSKNNIFVSVKVSQIRDEYAFKEELGEGKKYYK